MCTDGAVRDQTGRTVTRRDANYLHEVVFIRFLTHREELDRAIDWQVGGFEGLAWLTTRGCVGICQHVADSDHRFFEGERFEAAAGTAKLTANAPAAIPTIHPSNVRRVLPGDAVLSEVEMCFMADKGLLVEEQ